MLLDGTKALTAKSSLPSRLKSPTAVENGAVAVLVHEERPEYARLKSKAAFFVVPDTLKGLQGLARFWRAFYAVVLPLAKRENPDLAAMEARIEAKAPEQGLHQNRSRAGDA